MNPVKAWACFGPTGGLLIGTIADTEKLSKAMYETRLLSAMTQREYDEADFFGDGGYTCRRVVITEAPTKRKGRAK